MKGDETVAQLDKDVQLVVEDHPDLHRLHHGGELVQDLLGLEEQRVESLLHVLVRNLRERQTTLRLERPNERV